MANNTKAMTKLQQELEGFDPRLEAIEEQITQRAELIKAKKQQSNNVEDEIFADFCNSIGVSNIRQYDERELRAQQDRAKKRLDFENQKSRLLNQLEFEQSRDTEGKLLDATCPYACCLPLMSTLCIHCIAHTILSPTLL